MISKVIEIGLGTPALDSPMASMVAKQVDYASIIGADGSLGATVQMLANGYGLEWGELLTVGKQSFATGTVSGTSINFGAVSSAFGAAAYLHVFSVASGTATFTVQDSDDDSSFTAITGLADPGRRADILGDPTTRNVDTLCAVLIDGARPVSR